MFQYTIRALYPDEYIMIRNAISKNYFLKKCTWSKPLSEMAYDGLVKKKWTGFACFGEAEGLMSYCDYKIHNEREIEIGICLTLEPYRGRGMAKSMLQFLLACYPNHEVTIGTSENNKSMIACIEKMGFIEEYRIPNDRVNGDASIHYRHLA